MMPQHLATPVPHGHSIRSRIAIAVDDSEYSPRALGYVGTLLRDARDVHVTLLHVLKPMPRELLEHRRVQREPMTGRGHVSLKARFMSAHTLKGSERDGDVGTLLTEQPCRLSRPTVRPGHPNFFRV